MKKPMPILSGLFAVVIVLVIAGVLLLSNSSNEDKSESDSNNDQPGVAKYTLEDIAKHDSKEDCWMAIDDSVYDVTDYIDSHPGGEEILDGCGIDSTSIFMRRPSDGRSHSITAQVTLERYLIGELEN